MLDMHFTCLTDMLARFATAVTLANLEESVAV
jgi:hypothetical protein